jgi:hypothetical protein
MGTWGTKINANDTFQDVYQRFFAFYNNGHTPVDISKGIQHDFGEMFADFNDRNNALFGLALAQWETKSLDAEISSQVKSIIESGQDLEVWKASGAGDRLIEKRKRELERFLGQINEEREKPKRKQKSKFEFERASLVSIVSPDNLKRFDVNDEFINKEYVNTSGIVMWAQGGGSILYFTGQGKEISARWVDSQTLEITHENDIVFTQKSCKAYFSGDEVQVCYKTTSCRASLKSSGAGK